VVTKLMAPKPDDRYPDMAAVAAALDAFTASRFVNRTIVAGWFGALFEADTSAVAPTPPAVTLGGLSRSDPYALGSKNPSTPVLAFRDSGPTPASAVGPVAAVSPSLAVAPAVPPGAASAVPPAPAPASVTTPRAGVLLAAGVVVVLVAGVLTAVVWSVQPFPPAMEVADNASARETLRIVRGFADSGDPDAGLEVLERVDRERWAPEQADEGRSLEARLRVQRASRRADAGDRPGAEDDARAAIALVPDHPEAVALLARLASSPAEPAEAEAPKAEPARAISERSPSPSAPEASPPAASSTRAAPSPARAAPPPAPAKQVPPTPVAAPAPGVVPAAVSPPPPAPSIAAAPPVVAAPTPASTAPATTLSSVKVDVSGGQVALRARTTGVAVRPLALQMTQDGEGVVVVRLKSTDNGLPFQSLPVASDLARQIRVVEKGDMVEVTFTGVPTGVKVDVVPTASGFDVVLAGGS
jgi:hypothetical protein